MAGLLSGLDILLGATMDAILARLHLEPKLAAAITHHDGPTGVLLAAVLAFEQGDYTGLLALDIHAAEANAAYLEAIRWSENVRAQW
jgi:c-di-GMP-related signal transduction protein